MQDLKKVQRDAEELVDFARKPMLETSPFLYHLAARTLYSGAWGAFFSFVFFRGNGRLKRGFVFGAGFGLGLSSSQIQALWHEFSRDGAARDAEFNDEINSI